MLGPQAVDRIATRYRGIIDAYRGAESPAAASSPGASSLADSDGGSR